jgi:hypothetical protein
MEIRTYRSLDRSAQIFTIKGRFIIPMGIGAAVSLVAALAVGVNVNGLVGIALFLILFFGCAAAVVALQGRMSEKELARRLALLRRPQYIHVKPKRLISGWRSTEK